MTAKPKPLPLDPPATEAELERASQIWTAAQDVMVARGFGRHLWGNQHFSGHEFVVLMLREVEARRVELDAFGRVTIAEQQADIDSLRMKNTALEAQIREYKRTIGEMADRLRERGTADNIGAGANR